MTHADELAQGKRFPFGENWALFLERLDDDRIDAAERSVREFLGDIKGLRFLDIGCGSGLFSLVARRLGATVHSFDFDPLSVGCAQELKRRYFPDDSGWTIEEGSVLDRSYTEALGHFDVVYSWGVLHHTGHMWEALDNATLPVSPGGRLLIAIYNDQGWLSNAWRGIKRTYCSGRLGKAAISAWWVPTFYGAYAAYDLLRGRPPWRRSREHKADRGMSIYRDIHDWLGGYPFEVAGVKGIFDFFAQRGFRLDGLTTVGGSSGNNEFLFVRDPVPAGD